jgi:flagellar basal-body rod protein FlgG
MSLRAAQIAATGMSAMQLNVEVISNNIANLNSTGYKRRIAGFQDLLYQSMNRDVGTQTTVGGNITPVGTLVGLGVKTSGIFSNTSQGTLIQTGGTYDLAIQGRGYFRLTDANGNIYYTRDGKFTPDANGILVSAQGYTLDPSITIPTDADEVTINAQGEVLVTITGQTTPTNSGRITLTNFINEAGLRPEGNNNYSESVASGTPTDSNPGEIGFGTLQAGYTESSNVDSVFEITNLITAQRAYELNSKVISTADEMMNAVNQIR